MNSRVISPNFNRPDVRFNLITVSLKATTPVTRWLLAVYFSPELAPTRRASAASPLFFHFHYGKPTEVQPPCTVAGSMDDAHPTVRPKCNSLNGANSWV
jgi:hypothetical protein